MQFGAVTTLPWDASAVRRAGGVRCPCAPAPMCLLGYGNSCRQPVRTGRAARHTACAGQSSPFPLVALRALNVLSGTDASLRELCDLIRPDPVFAAEVLRIANSPLVAFFQGNHQRSTGVDPAGVPALEETGHHAGLPVAHGQIIHSGPASLSASQFRLRHDRGTDRAVELDRP